MYHMLKLRLFVALLQNLSKDNANETEYFFLRKIPMKHGTERTYHHFVERNVEVVNDRETQNRQTSKKIDILIHPHNFHWCMSS